MWRRLAESKLAFRLLLALPFLGMAIRYLEIEADTRHLLEASGEWAARLLIATLLVTPLRILMKQAGLGPHWPMWLFKQRRSLGLAAFLYGAFHMGVYVARQDNLHVILYDLPYREYLAGWSALALMAVLALTSNDWSVHRFGRWWKPLQRLAYAAVIAAYLHWLWIRQDHTAAILHALPLVMLEAYRLWYNFARPAGARH